MILLLAVIVRYADIEKNRISGTQQAYVDGSAVARTDGSIIDKRILIMDDEQIITDVPIFSHRQEKSAVVVNKPYISAESYLVGNLDTGEIYIDFNSGKVFPIASVSKLYTALVVQHLFDHEKKIKITQSMLDAYGDAGHLVVDEEFTANELLYPLLLESSNDTAEAYAQSFGYSGFMDEMNGFAKEIGLEKTSFNDASGLSPKNISNAKDLFTLAKYFYTNEKDILAVSSTKVMDFATTTDHGSHHLININPYASYENFIGGKTGRTDEARESMVSLFAQPVDGIKYNIAVIILRSDFGEREIDTEKLLGMFMDKISKK